jgi:hypothetical protein
MAGRLAAPNTLFSILILTQREALVKNFHFVKLNLRSWGKCQMWDQFAEMEMSFCWMMAQRVIPILKQGSSLFGPLLALRSLQLDWCYLGQLFSGCSWSQIDPLIAQCLTCWSGTNALDCIWGIPHQISVLGLQVLKFTCLSCARLSCVYITCFVKVL